jgi:hypothetical protein
MRFDVFGQLQDVGTPGGQVTVLHIRVCRGPLHRLALAFALRARHALLIVALVADDTPLEKWNDLASLIFDDGRDPNWRSRPSVLDTLLGLTAARGRPRKKKLRDCRPSAAPYRKAAWQ